VICIDRSIDPHGYGALQSSDGDTIDCVAAQSQHGLEHPLLEGHAIQTEPPEVPRSRGGASFFRRFPAAAAAAADGASSTTNLTINKQPRSSCWQTWHHSGHCPPGTVAVRRTTAEDVLRARFLARFGRKKKKRSVSLDAARAANAPDVVSGNGHEVLRLFLVAYLYCIPWRLLESLRVGLN
jgi:hypothetical protein